MRSEQEVKQQIRALEEQRAKHETAFMEGQVGKNRKDRAWRENEQRIGRINARIHALLWAAGDTHVRIPSEPPF